MHYNTPCYTCEHYRPTGNSEVGLCRILEDCAGPVYFTSSSQQKCLFDLTKPATQLTLEEAKTRDKAADAKRQGFWKHLEKVKREVESWPEWKKEATRF